VDSRYSQKEYGLDDSESSSILLLSYVSTSLAWILFPGGVARLYFRKMCVAFRFR
jgi:hypothetical protein